MQDVSSLNAFIQNFVGITPEEKQLSVSGQNWGEVDLNGNWLFLLVLGHGLLNSACTWCYKLISMLLPLLGEQSSFRMILSYWFFHLNHVLFSFLPDLCFFILSSLLITFFSQYYSKFTCRYHYHKALFQLC